MSKFMISRHLAVITPSDRLLIVYPFGDSLKRRDNFSRWESKIVQKRDRDREIIYSFILFGNKCTFDQKKKKTDRYSFYTKQLKNFLNVETFSK